MQRQFKTELIEQPTTTINSKIAQLEEKIREYGSFDVVANTFVENQIGINGPAKEDRAEKSNKAREAFAHRSPRHSHARRGETLTDIAGWLRCN